MEQFQPHVAGAVLQRILLLLGATLLLRAFVVPDVRRRWFQTNRLSHWHVTPAEVSLLISATSRAEKGGA